MLGCGASIGIKKPTLVGHGNLVGGLIVARLFAAFFYDRTGLADKHFDRGDAVHEIFSWIGLIWQFITFNLRDVEHTRCSRHKHPSFGLFVPVIDLVVFKLLVEDDER